MVRKLFGLVAAVLLALSFAGSLLADEITGTITKVEVEGRKITVKGKDKEVTVGISGSRTKLEGIGDRSEFKQGQNVTVEYSGDDAKKVTVKKAK